MAAERRLRGIPLPPARRDKDCVDCVECVELCMCTGQRGGLGLYATYTAALRHDTAKGAKPPAVAPWPCSALRRLLRTTHSAASASTPALDTAAHAVGSVSCLLESSPASSSRVPCLLAPSGCSAPSGVSRGVARTKVVTGGGGGGAASAVGDSAARSGALRGSVGRRVSAEGGCGAGVAATTGAALAAGCRRTLITGPSSPATKFSRVQQGAC
jgi:hypothetical protein